MISKFFCTIIIAGGLIISIAQACPRTLDQFICPGDQVVTEDNIIATVVGVNPFQGTVAVQNVLGSIFTRPKASLALGMGCLEMYCVGDLVVNQKNVSGRILAVNPYRGTIAFQDFLLFVHTENLFDLALGLGCLKGVCVNDEVISHDNMTGEIVAINPFNQKVVFRNIMRYLYTRALETFSLTKYCETYGEEPRSIIRYPVLDESYFLAPEFQFSLKRPVH